ncbi:MAG: hypothetical protein HY763_03300 [Planctomycetes bacterium]|nr:hypothetical protein [Planctomycetota bacterium]
MSDGTEPIADDELLYRRVPEAWFDRKTDARPSPLAFKPREGDVTGISVSRGKYKTPEQAAVNQSGKSYYVAVLRAGDLRTCGMDVVARPQEGDPGHAEIPELTFASRQTPTAKGFQLLLAERLCREVLGPFPEAS